MPQTVSGWAERAWIGLIQVAPLRAYTRLIRVVSGIPLPRKLRGPIFGGIGQRMGMDLSEAAGELSEYRCFAELFARSLRDGLRPVEQTAEVLVSPVDGAVSGMGQISQDSLIQAKGIHYPLSELVASPPLARALDGGTYLTLYLQPSDYHRIHAPVAGRVVRMTRVSGSLFPVKPYAVRGVHGLYVRNERVVFELATPLGPLAMVCVAAAGVGNITTRYDGVALGPDAVLDAPVEKGEEMARFNLGSTVIVVCPAGAVELRPLSPGQHVRMGQRVADVRVAPKP